MKSAPDYFREAEDQKIINKIIDSNESTEEIFSALVANREKNYSNAGLTGLSLDVEERLINQINMRSYEIVLKGRALQESSRKARAIALKLATGGVALGLLVIIAAAFFNLWSMGRVITERVGHLYNGAVAIGGGDLDYLIDIKGDDEFTELSAKFNAMTKKLSDSYHNLEYEITERKRAEEKIKASLEEKEVMLKEIHHRVKNNLQVISSLISLQADSLTDKRILKELDDVRDRVRSMALIHEKLYQTSDLAKLDFAEYAASLTQTLWRSHSALARNIRLNLAVEPVSLSIERSVPCGLILNELVANALKHAFPNNSGGEVEVGVKIDPANKVVCLRVRDNGIGLPTGLDWSQSHGLGLQLVKILAGQLGGTVETATSPGTEFKIVFPLKEDAR